MNGTQATLRLRAQDRHCRCGLPKNDAHLVCLVCWRAAPAEARRNLHDLDIETRRAAARTILQIAIDRSRFNPNPGRP